MSVSALISAKFQAVTRVINRPIRRTLGPQWNRVTPRATAPRWLIPVLQALAKLRQLPNDWDGYGSPPLRLAVIETADQLVETLEGCDLPVPHVYPVTGGGVSFSWQRGGKELDIEIHPNGAASYLAVLTDANTGEESETEGSLPVGTWENTQALANWLVED